MKPNIALAVGLACLVAIPLSAQRRARPPTKDAAKPPAARAAAPRTERPVPFHVGERLTFDVSWSTFVTAGTVVATVQEKKPSFDSTAYYIVAEGRPTPLVAKLYSLYYKLDTLLDSYTLLPQRGSVYSEEGKRHRLKVTRFDQTAHKVFFEYQAAGSAKDNFAVAPYVQDVLSAIYVLRAVPLKAGDRMTMPVTDSGSKYKAQLEIGAAERVRTPSGDASAWKLKTTVVDDAGRAQGKNVFIWISTDERRLPMKVQAELPVGSFNLSLRAAK